MENYRGPAIVEPFEAPPAPAGFSKGLRLSPCLWGLRSTLRVPRVGERRRQYAIEPCGQDLEVAPGCTVAHGRRGLCGGPLPLWPGCRTLRR